MEGNACDDGVIVPPRKRLLAGFKKLNSNSDQSCGSSASPPLNATEADNRVKNLLGSYISASGDYSLEEVVDRANKAALAAAKVAEAARTVAEEKAAIAAKAIAAAKTALDLVAEFHEEIKGRHIHTKKSKSKRWVAVHSVNKKRVEDENNATDEEELHQGIYRTHRLYKHSPPSSDFKHKRPKILIEKTNIPNGKIFDVDSRASFSSDAKLDTEGSRYEVSPFENDKEYSLTKLVSSSWRMDKENIFAQKRIARKQLIRIVE